MKTKGKALFFSMQLASVSHDFQGTPAGVLPVYKRRLVMPPDGHHPGEGASKPRKGVRVSEQRQRFLEDWQLNYYAITELSKHWGH
jgi:hypothetical protein